MASRVCWATCALVPPAVWWQSYQTWWRMQLAWSALSAGEPVVAAAQSVGYYSEAAFSRAFYKYFGTHAGTVRRNRGAG